MALAEAVTDEDDALLKTLASGEPPDPCWNQLLERYQGRLFLFARGLTRDEVLAEEVVQECFVELWKAVVIKKGVIRHLRAWLYKLASRKALTKIQERRNAMPTLEATHMNNTARTSHKDSDREELLVHVYHQVNAMPDRLRLPILLHFGSGHSQTEIASMLDCRQSTVSERIGEALEQLKSHLSKLGFAALPLPLTSLLSNTLEAPPPSMLAGVKLKAISSQAVVHSGRTVAVSSGKGPWIGATLALGTVLAATAYFALPNTNTAAPAPVVTSPAPLALAPLASPSWNTWKIDGFTTPGKVSGKWTLQQSPEGPTSLSYVPNTVPSPGRTYCYVNGQYKESIEWQGVIELPEKLLYGTFEIGLIHPNQINCSVVEWNLERSHFPIRFQAQIWHDELGTRMAIRLKSANGKEGRSHDRKEWRDAPWKAVDQMDESVWMKFKGMPNFGFTLAANTELKFTELQTRTLVKENLIYPLE